MFTFSWHCLGLYMDRSIFIQHIQPQGYNPDNIFGWSYYLNHFFFTNHIGLSTNSQKVIISDYQVMPSIWSLTYKFQRLDVRECMYLTQICLCSFSISHLAHGQCPYSSDRFSHFRETLPWISWWPRGYSEMSQFRTYLRDLLNPIYLEMFFGICTSFIRYFAWLPVWDGRTFDAR